MGRQISGSVAMIVLHARNSFYLSAWACWVEVVDGAGVEVSEPVDGCVVSVAAFGEFTLNDVGRAGPGADHPSVFEGVTVVLPLVGCFEGSAVASTVSVEPVSPYGGGDVFVDFFGFVDGDEGVGVLVW